MVRVEPALHARLRREAAATGRSLNDLCIAKLSAAPPQLPDELSLLVSLAAERFGEELVGVVLYGSWIRGEATTDSDVDVLVVLQPDAILSASLYSQWDRPEMKVGESPIDVHFTRLPYSGDLPTGLWAEVALDGRVLFERDLLLTRYLATARRRIAAGEIVRRTSHGQPYWVVAS